MLKLPGVRSTRPSGDSAAAHSSLVVVLPFEPVTPTTSPRNSARTARASWPSAARGSSTAMIAAAGTPRRQPAVARDDDGRGARRRRLRREREPVDALARQREEELPGLHGAAVGGRARERAVAGAHLQQAAVHRAHGEARCGRRAALHAGSASAAAASSRSSKCSRVDADDLVVLVPLAGDQQHVAAARGAAARRIAVRRSTSTW